MHNNKLIPGAVLVIIGTLFLLDNFGVIYFNWFSIFHLWPIFLVIAGVNLVFANNRGPAATAVKMGVLALGMVFLIFNGIGHRADRYNHGWRNAFNHFDFKDDDDDDNDARVDTAAGTGIDSGRNTNGNGHYAEGYKPTVKTAVLNVSGGATSYLIRSTDITNQLFEADTKEFGGGIYSLKTTGDSTTETLNFDMNGEHHHRMSFQFGNGKANKATLKLNTNPQWDINVEAGAAKIDFDLSNYKVKNLKLEGGAASFEVKMGQPLAVTNLDVSTGVSGVTISIPQNAACRIITDTGISSNKFDGFQKTGDDQYQTPNFDKAANKMFIKLSGGISDFKVNRY